jgi:hypothetical protein
MICGVMPLPIPTISTRHHPKAVKIRLLSLSNFWILEDCSLVNLELNLAQTQLIFVCNNYQLSILNHERQVEVINTIKRNSYVNRLSELQSALYILRCVSEGKNEEQIVERFLGDQALVKTWLAVLREIHLLEQNSLNELVITKEGREYLQRYNPHW